MLTSFLFLCYNRENAARRQGRSWTFLEELKPGRYRHFKGGEYRVIGVATHSETMEKMVVYAPLYNDSGLWVRPLSMFLETVEREGKTFPRFTYIGE
ncbi:DUF1653 domain-containing protein [Oscillospiraceae bacterium NSJ-54]|uniref:DUF1653 domain-containing protein n=1 Tax=Zongyangia hominis TaxID=2763677 RepID=A0A926EAK0_9FIRM|nr:DUF1653 domain-containing protein [Zongyangia hominis]